MLLTVCGESVKMSLKMAERKDKKVFDVADPGSSAALPTARPVIVARRAIERDPMMAEQKKPKTTEPEPKNDADKDVATDLPQENTTDDTHSKKVIQPLESTKDDAKLPEEDTKPKDDEESEEATPDTADEKSDKTSAKKSAKGDPKQQEIQDKYKKLIEDKTYYAPIGVVKRRRNTRLVLVILLLTLLIIAAAANFLVDAEIIQTDIKPLTDVIPN